MLRLLSKDPSRLVGPSLRFTVTSIEYSMYMNLVYHYLLTQPRPRSSTFHPFIDWCSHHASTADMTRAISFPDISVRASSVVHIEGDFVNIFHTANRQYDTVVTLLFTDTAANIMNYLETIYSVLKPGGIWINFAPLLWNSAPLVQLSLNEILDLAEELGYEFMDPKGD
ncbi:hypothetical protein ABEF95_001788 [Exophiala dermatitidis]